MVEYTRDSVNKLNVTRLIFPTKELSMRGFPFGRRTETYPTAPMTNTFPVADAAADITLPNNSDMFYDSIVTPIQALCSDEYIVLYAWPGGEGKLYSSLGRMNEKAGTVCLTHNS